MRIGWGWLLKSRGNVSPPLLGGGRAHRLLEFDGIASGVLQMGEAAIGVRLGMHIEFDPRRA